MVEQQHDAKMRAEATAMSSLEVPSDRARAAPAIRAILFDADGIIQDSTVASIGQQLQRLTGLGPDQVDPCMHEIFQVERAALIGKADFADALAPVLEKWRAPAVATTLAAEWGCTIDLDRALLDLVAQLRRQGFTCALATNQQHYRAAHMNRTFAYDAAFDHCFYSCRVGATKPDEAYFRAILTELGCPPHEVLFIDDAEKNVAGARRAGLQAALFTHSGEASLASMLDLLARFSIAVNDGVSAAGTKEAKGR